MTVSKFYVIPGIPRTRLIHCKHLSLLLG